MIKARGNAKWALFLTALVVFSIVNNIVWLMIDTRPPRWDESHYLGLSLTYYDALASGGLVSLAESLVSADRARPPLLPLSAILGLGLFGRSEDAAFALQIVFHAILILVTYGAGYKIASPRCGLLAAFLVAFYPGIYSLARLFLLDFLHATLIACTLFALVWSEGFARRGASVLAGVAVGLGLMCRTFFPVFVVGPLALTIHAAARTEKEVREDGTSPLWRANLLWAALSAAAIAMPWYWVNLDPVIRRSLSAAFGAESAGYGPRNPLSFFEVSAFFMEFGHVPPSFVGLVLFVSGTSVLCRHVYTSSIETIGNLNHRDVFYVLFSSVLVPFLFLAALPTRDLKDITPSLPAMAILSAWGLSSMRSRWAQRVVVGVGCLLLFLQFWPGSYSSIRSLEPEITLHRRLPTLRLIHQGSVDPNDHFLVPARENWRIEDVVSRVSQRWRAHEAQRALVLIVPDHPLFNENNLRYYSLLTRAPITVERVGARQPIPGADLRGLLYSADYVVGKTGNAGPDRSNPNNAAILELLASPESEFVELRPRIPLPDGSLAVVYARKDQNFIRAETRRRSPIVVFQHGVELLGYEIEELSVSPTGADYALTLYWRPQNELTRDYRIFVHITERGSSELQWGWDHWPVGGRSTTSTWTVGRVVEDRGVYRLPRPLSRGEHEMKIGLYLPDTGERLRIMEARGSVAVDEGTRALIGSIPAASRSDELQQ